MGHLAAGQVPPSWTVGPGLGPGPSHYGLGLEGGSSAEKCLKVELEFAPSWPVCVLTCVASVDEKSPR